MPYDFGLKSDLVELAKKVIPNGNRIVVAIHEREKMTISGVLRSSPKRGEDETLEATVVSVGVGYWTENGQFIPVTAKVGDRVLIDKMSGVTVRIDRKGTILPFHEEVTDDRLSLRIVRQEAVLWTFPTDWVIHS